MSNRLLQPLDADNRRALENVRGATARIWSRPGRKPAATVKVPPGVVWARLSENRLTYLARDGRLLQHTMNVKLRSGN